MCCTWGRGSLKIQNAKRMQKLAICAPSHNFARLYLRNESMYRQSEKTCQTAISPPHAGPLTSETRWRVSALQQISTGFTSWLRYCSVITQRKSTKLCTVFGHLLGWYTIFTFSGALAPQWNSARCKIHFASKSCFLLFWQCYGTVLEQWASAKLCGMVQGMELWNFCFSSFSTEGTTYIPRAAIMLGIGPHSSYYLILLLSTFSWHWIAYNVLMCHQETTLSLTCVYTGLTVQNLELF